MVNERDLDAINGEIRLLEIQRELIESERWDDKTHLEKKYKMHENTFYNVLRYLCNSVGGHIKKDINENGVFSFVNRNGIEANFDISKDDGDQRGDNKLISFIYPNERLNSRVLLFYSPTKGVAFEYSSDFLTKNIQLGKNDFFGKTIEKMVKDISSSTENVNFETYIERFGKSPHGLKHFYFVTKDFVEKEKQGDIISAISLFDGLIDGIHKNTPWVYGPNFIHEKEGPLFNISIKFGVNDWLNGERI
jgi:hypothetical protein